ncbi:Protein kinase [Mycena indigotica]|uniref:non-specific serine/threonine protein kinase n=1 Tax=Mycena indigotica TaxID=2126181 RepID=A0A8H6W750_9AGAR|nr:Protein kinase [Mycena indigotica]KAF7307322.1 Protein kinase [Mycena indigotica]
MTSVYPSPHCEHPLDYEPGGLHPVHIGDIFANGRYEVMDKLGFGYSSTIWLVRDLTTATYASLKILEARRTVSPTELVVLKHLEATFNAEEEGSKHVVRMLDHFVHEGPNGAHMCIVQELLVPALAVDIVMYDGHSCLPVATASRIVGQLLLAVDYLHKRGIAHGDLHSGNILVCLPPTFDLEVDFRKPIKQARGLPTELSPHRPQYLVVPIGPRLPASFLRSCLSKPSIKLCDFSESYMIGMTEPPCFASPHFLRPPEGILDEILHATPETDIWALAVAIYHILTSGCGLFSINDDHDYILASMVLVLGKFPEPLWVSWTGRGKFLDENADPVPNAIGPVTSLSNKVECWLCDEKQTPALTAMLDSMLRYEAKARSTASDIVHSQWMENFCRPYMGEDVVLPIERRKIQPNIVNITPQTTA